jgi:hypothetical protein
MNRDDGNGDGRYNIKQTIAMINFVFTDTGYFDPYIIVTSINAGLWKR